MAGFGRALTGSIMALPGFLRGIFRRRTEQPPTPVRATASGPPPPGSPLIFRSARSGDIARMAELYNAEIANGHFIDTGAPVVMFFAQAVLRGRVRLASPIGAYETPVFVEVATRGAELVGFTTIKAWIDVERLAMNIGRGRTEATTSDFELWMLAVAPAERGRGTGTALLERQIAKALSLAGSDGQVVARCFTASDQAERMLLRAGFSTQKVSDTGKEFRLRRGVAVKGGIR